MGKSFEWDTYLIYLRKNPIQTGCEWVIVKWIGIEQASLSQSLDTTELKLSSMSFGLDQALGILWIDYRDLYLTL